MTPLTPRQRAAYTAFCALSIRHAGVPPTVREVADYMGLSSSNTAWAHLRNLADKGWLVRKPGRALAYRLPPQEEHGKP